jgi:hypothetical protein
MESVMMIPPFDQALGLRAVLTLAATSHQLLDLGIV